MPKEKKQEKAKEKHDAGALFIPAGILIGFGVGFIVNNIPASMFIGLGAGFLAWAIIRLFKK